LDPKSAESARASSALLHRVHSFPTTMRLDLCLDKFESVCAEPEIHGRSPVPLEQGGDVARFSGVALTCRRLLATMAAECDRESR
jgi:hypothetical protein